MPLGVAYVVLLAFDLLGRKSGRDFHTRRPCSAPIWHHRGGGSGVCSAPGLLKFRPRHTIECAKVTGEGGTLVAMSGTEYPETARLPSGA